MNMMLHGIGTQDLPIVVTDSFAADPGDRFNFVMTNPPFGKKSSATIIGEEGLSPRRRKSTNVTTSVRRPRTSNLTSSSM